MGDPNAEDKHLPPRLFATDRYPDARLNIYSKLEILKSVQLVLSGTQLWERIRESQFGQLYDTPLSRCLISGKLIHALLSRQLVTNQKYEMWIVFGGHPFRFGLHEFGAVTGLDCNEFDYGYFPDFKIWDKEWEPDQSWLDIIGSDPKTTVHNLVDILKNEGHMEDERKLHLALICIVDGVLIANTQAHRPTPRYVKLVSNLEKFLHFPWGRESFLRTISTMRPEITTLAYRDDACDTFRNQLRSGTMRICGFPLALQLLAFKQIPNLLKQLKDAPEIQILRDHDHEKIPKKGSLALKEVHLAESEPNLTVKPTLEIHPTPEHGGGVWDDETTDNKVTYMIRKIQRGELFSKSDWWGGLSTLPIIKVHRPSPKSVHNQNNQIRGNAVKRKLEVDDTPSSSRKRCLPSRDKSKQTITSIPDYHVLSSRIDNLIEEVKLLRKEQRALHILLHNKKQKRLPKMSEGQRSLRRISITFFRGRLPNQ